MRYLLIDTPETKKPGTPQQPFGKEASERTEQLIQNRNRIRPGRHKRQIRPCSSLCIY
ncbi:thermonuclease family protein [Enterococcus termitis]